MPQISKEEPNDLNTSLLGENRRLVADEPVELKKPPPVEVGDFRRITDHHRGIYQISKEEPNDHNISLLGENRRLVADELVEFEKPAPVEVGDFRRITDHCRGIYKNIPQMNKSNTGR